MGNTRAVHVHKNYWCISLPSSIKQQQRDQIIRFVERAPKRTISNFAFRILRFVP